MKDADGWDPEYDPTTGVATITTSAGRRHFRIRDAITHRRGGTTRLNPPPKPRLPKPEPLPDDPPF